MARIPVSFAYGPKDLLPSTHRIGTFYAVTDEGEQRLYVDLPDGKRLPMGMPTFARVFNEVTPDGLLTTIASLKDVGSNQLNLDFDMVSTSRMYVQDLRLLGNSLDLGDSDTLQLTYNGYSGPATISVKEPTQPGHVTTRRYVDVLVEGLTTRLSALETSSLRREVVERLPEYADRESNTIYMVPNTSGEDTNYYDEYLVIEKPPTPVDAGGWVPISSCVDETGNEVVEGGLSYCYVESYHESGPSGYDLCEVTFVDRFDPERKITIWARLDELQSTNLIEYFVASTEEYTNDVHRFYFSIQKQTNDPNVSIYVTEIPRDLEFIGTTKCDLTGKQDKFANVLLQDQTAVLTFMSNEKQAFYGSTIRICDQSNIGIVVETDLINGQEYQYGVTLHCDGPGGQGLNVIVEPTPRGDNSATSKAYVDSMLADVEDKLNQLQSTVQGMSEQLTLSYAADLE